MEFDLIARHFTRATPGAVLGVGDDCALLAPTPGMQLAVSSDMLLEGRHFAPQDSPAGLGHKSLAVNLSDLAAMGATPRLRSRCRPRTTPGSPRLRAAFSASPTCTASSWSAATPRAAR
jgi:hypothetical protein